MVWAYKFLVIRMVCIFATNSTSIGLRRYKGTAKNGNSLFSDFPPIFCCTFYFSLALRYHLLTLHGWNVKGVEKPFCRSSFHCQRKKKKYALAVSDLLIQTVH